MIDSPDDVFCVCKCGGIDRASNRSTTDSDFSERSLDTCSFNDRQTFICSEDSFLGVLACSGLLVVDVRHVRRSSLDAGPIAFSDDEDFFEGQDEYFQLKQLRGARRTLKALRRYVRPQRVRPALLAAQCPGKQDDVQQAANVLARLKAAFQKKPSISPFDCMRDAFWARSMAELRYAFGPDAVVSKTYLSNMVEHRFMSRLWKCNSSHRESIQLAFHGTAKDNFAPIFRQGFLLPGDVRVAHGNAHGAGIYTARQGAASLSQSFCDSKSMLVCGVIDGDAVHAFDDTDALAMLRIGRRAKRPSASSRASPLAPAIPRILGNFQVHKDTGEVRHVGDAMVVFNPSCVAPLLRVDNIPNALYKHPPPSPESGPSPNQDEDEAARQWQTIYWPSEGNLNKMTTKSDDLLTASSHEKRVKRVMARCARQHNRRAAREAKSCVYNMC